MKQLDMFLDKLFQTDVNIDTVTFWLLLTIGIVATALIATVGCQLDDLFTYFRNKKGNKKKKRKG